MYQSTVVLRSVNGQRVRDVVRDILDRCNYREIVRANCRVAVKVNLSTPFEENAAASNTSPEILDAVLDALKERTSNIIVVESNGMRYDTEDAFRVSGYYPILARHDVEAFNLSKDERRETGEPRLRGWGLSKTLLDVDVFITLPVLKTHATTVFTGTLKNQFGCYPQHDRILLHPHLDDVIVLINKILKPRLAIMDGIIGMEGRGPINGKPVELGVVLGSTDPVALDATAMRLVGLDPYTSKHVVLASGSGLGEIAEEAIAIDGDFDSYAKRFEPAERDLPIRLLGLMSHSSFLTRKLILNPESFYPLRTAAMVFREVRDYVLGLVGQKRAS